MHLTKKIIAVVICAALVIGTIFAGKYSSLNVNTEKHENNDSLVIWYADDAMTDYLNAMAVEYHETYGVRVIPKLQSGNEYIESIYDASIKDEGAPDLYIVTNDSLEKAYLSGCATVITDEEDEISDRNFSQGGMGSILYHSNKIAYPYYFETSVLLYNRTYLQEYAYNQIYAEDKEAGLIVEEASSEASGETESSSEDSTSSDSSDKKKNESESSEASSSTESSSEESEEETTTELSLDEKLDSEMLGRVEDRIKNLLPDTFEGLLSFADAYTPPAEMEYIFKWDVKDIFYNYCFVGNYLNVGGNNGDDPEILDIYNLDAINALKMYQSMNQFFSFEYDNITYDEVINEFLEGKILYTIVTTDALKTLDEAMEHGEFKYTYGMSAIPNLNAELKTKNLSVTDCLVINGYSDRKDDANAFAKFLAIDHADDLFAKTGKVSSNINVKYENPYVNVYMDEYATSSPMPKMMATSNYWLKLESVLADVWGGNYTSDNLKKLSEQMKLQVSGIIIEEEYIDAKDEQETVEYFDEEQLKQEAMNEADE